MQFAHPANIMAATASGAADSVVRSGSSATLTRRYRCRRQRLSPAFARAREAISAPSAVRAPYGMSGLSYRGDGTPSGTTAGVRHPPKAPIS